MDFTYRGVRIEDTWSSGARCSGSRTRSLHHQREDGSQRWAADLPTGDRVWTFTQQEMREAIDQAHALSTTAAPALA